MTLERCDDVCMEFANCSGTLCDVFAAIGCTPLKINMELMEPKNEGLEDDFPLQKAVFQVRHLII